MDEREPDLVVKGLSIWFHERAYPDATDKWDRDTNRCSAIAVANGARVELSGFVGSINAHHFAISLERLHERLEGEAQLDGSDLGLSVWIKSTPLGHMAISVEMLPDYGATQSHRFEFQGDQTDLLPIARQCRKVLKRLPTTLL